MMRVLGKVFLATIVTLLLLRGMMITTYSQAVASGERPMITATGCWSVVPSPSPGTYKDYLKGVATISASNIWAVGLQYNSDGSGITLIEHWDGTSWSIISSPSPGTGSNQLLGVTAISPNDVWAVGSDNNVTNTSSFTLIEHWDGAIWSVVPSPSPGASYNYLVGIAALSANDIWAVGSDGNSGTSTLIEHWNGTVWSIVPSPSPGAYTNDLFAVAAVSSNNVWAVGGYYSNATAGGSLVEHWDGSSWTVIPSPSPSTGQNDLYGVAIVSASNIWAVGGFDHNGGGSLIALVEHWNGTSWNTVPSPQPAYFNILNSVTAISSNDVWTVGFDAGGESTGSLTEHWDGTSWAVVPSPNPSVVQNHLVGVSAISSSDVWAIGDEDNSTGTSTNTLVEHYGASVCPTSTPTITDTPAPSSTPAPTDTPQATVCPNPFVDIYTNIFFHAINALYCRSDVNGTDATHYTPAGASTRGQFAKVVTLGFGLPLYTPTGGQDFSDVPPAYFAYVYIESGYHAGILSGFDANTCTAYGVAFPCYLPNLAITRAQLTKLVVGAAHYPLYTPTSGQTFSDVPPSNIFYASIETAHNKGVINGYPDGTFRPNNNIRRDEMAQIVYKGVTTP